MIASQITALRADIISKQANGQPLNGLNEDAIAAYYNAVSATSVWRTEAPIDAIFDAITWASYTPNDLADNTATYTNRGLNIQTKQMNLQNMTIGRSTLNAAKPNVRGGLRDAVIQVPSGAAGVAQNPGGNSGATVLAACVRLANRIEALLLNAAITSGVSNDTTGTTSARVMGFEGTVTAQFISDVIAGIV